MLRSRFIAVGIIPGLVALCLFGMMGRARAQSSPSANASPSAAAPGAAASPSMAAPSAASNPNAQPSAQPQAAGSPTQLPDVAITATRITQPVSDIGVTTTVIHAQQIQDQKIQQTSDALREVPGVEVTQSGGPGTLTDVSIRGSATSQVLTLLDGVEVNTGGLGSFDFSNLTTDNANRIEVLRGAGGSLYGSSAIGGVINQITEEGTGDPKFSLLSDGGNWETQRQVATASGAIGKLGYSGSVSYYSTEGFQPVNSQYDNLSLTSRLDYHLTDSTILRFFGRYTGADVGLPENSNYEPGSPLDPTAHQRTEFMLFKAEIEQHFGEKLVVRVDGSFVRDEIRGNKTPTPLTNYGQSYDIPDEIRGANGEAIYTWTEGFTTLVGFDFKDRWGRDGDVFMTPPSPPFPSTTITVFNAARQEYAGYVQQQVSFFDGHLLGTGGFRVDGNSQFGEEVSPAWSVAIPFKETGTTLRGSYAEGFQAPTFDDLYFPGDGNPNLKPTISSEYDGSVEQQISELADLSVTYFSRRVHDLVANQLCTPSPTCPFGSLPANIGRADMQGVEVVPRLGPFYGLSLSGNFTVLDSTHRPLEAGLQPVRVPKRAAAAVAEYKKSSLIQDGDQFVSTLAYQFVGDRTDAQVVGTGFVNNPAYQLFNLTLSYKLADLAVPYLNHEEGFVRIQNLFDRHYDQAYGFPSPPVNFEAGVKLGFMP